MARCCSGCSRYWGRRWKHYHLCHDIAAKKRCFLFWSRQFPVIVRNIIGHFAGYGLRLSIPAPLPRGCSLCLLGSPKNCRCYRWRHVRDTRGNVPVVARLRRKGGRGRAIAARWVHLLALAAGNTPLCEYNALDGLLLYHDCRLGCAAPFLEKLYYWWGWKESWVGPIYRAGHPLQDVPPKRRVLKLVISVVMQYTVDRPGVKAMLGTALQESIERDHSWI